MQAGESCSSNNFESQSDIQNYGGVGGGVAMNADDSYTNVAGFFNFEVTGLNSEQRIANIVIPLQSAVAKGSVYRKYWPDIGWTDFVIDANAFSAYLTVNPRRPINIDFGKLSGPASPRDIANSNDFIFRRCKELGVFVTKPSETPRPVWVFLCCTFTNCIFYL